MTLIQLSFLNQEQKNILVRKTVIGKTFETTEKVSYKITALMKDMPRNFAFPL
jgi:hypothetical protein